MTGSISQKLARWVLLLYPEPFRDEFGDEMVSILAECRAAQGCCHVLADVLVSAAKQQIYYLSISPPKSAPLYSEIAWSPSLARILAVGVFCVVLLASALGGRGKSEGRESRTRPCTLNAIAADQTILQAIHFHSDERAHHE